MGKFRIAPLGAIGLLVACSAANALVTFTGTGTNAATGTSLAAEAKFEIDGSQLKITLSNIATSDVLAPSDVLTAVFFKLPTNPKLTKQSVVVAPASHVRFGTTDSGGVVGGEFAYRHGLNIQGQNQGVSSVGLGVFGPSNRFPGKNLAGPTSPDGLQYGITSAGDDPTTGNKAVTGSQALIQNSVLITLGLPSTAAIKESDIASVWFQYGTDLCEVGFQGRPGGPPSSDDPIPEPLTAVCCIAGLAALQLVHRGRGSLAA